MTELQIKWINAVEDYYRDSYPATMRKKVGEILPRTEPVLRALYDTVIRNVSAQYRTVPDVQAIEQAMAEVAEYQEMIATDALRIEDKGPVSRGEAAEFMGRLARALSEGVDPREDARIRREG